VPKYNFHIKIKSLIRIVINNKKSINSIIIIIKNI